LIKTLLMLLLLAVSLTFCNLVTGYGPGTGSRQNDIATGFIIFLPIVLILIFIIRKLGTDNDSQKVDSDSEITSPLASAKSDDILDGSNHSFSNTHKIEDQSDAIEKPDEEKRHLSKNILKTKNQPETGTEIKMDKKETLLSYDDEAQKIYKNLTEKFGQKFGDIFVKVLLENPTATHREAEREAKTVFEQEFCPFESDELNELYQKICELGAEAKKELESVLSVVGERVDKKSILEKIIEKHSKTTKKSDVSSNADATVSKSSVHDKFAEIPIEELIRELASRGYQTSDRYGQYTVKEPFGGRSKPMLEEQFREYAVSRIVYDQS
jgi:hypothetical protein